MTGPLISLFLSDECNPYVVGRLREEIDAHRNAYLTFNRFNVRIDAKSSTVTIEDELDPDAEESLTMDDFLGLLP